MSDVYEEECRRNPVPSLDYSYTELARGHASLTSPPDQQYLQMQGQRIWDLIPVYFGVEILNPVNKLKNPTLNGEGAQYC